MASNILNMRRKLLWNYCLLWLLPLLFKQSFGEDHVPFKAVNLGGWLETEGGGMTPTLFEAFPPPTKTSCYNYILTTSLIFPFYFAIFLIFFSHILDEVEDFFHSFEENVLFTYKHTPFTKFLHNLYFYLFIIFKSIFISRYYNSKHNKT